MIEIKETAECANKPADDSDSPMSLNGLAIEIRGPWRVHMWTGGTTSVDKRQQTATKVEVKGNLFPGNTCFVSLIVINSTLMTHIIET